MIIPFQSLDESALNGVLEDIASRDGTDYGETEASLAAKVRDLKRVLNTGEACLCFDVESETCNILPADTARAMFGSMADRE
ncbi:Uncharacterised protein [BD1-7 clade bacterium]|uniref:Uncharacterized protein n=1 Tax=BD1-7 clade bacterium TaxID=2029982 RepID=A0A5S9QG06_9GAMM|nr:Uncharacterised protein [BD1-7 clade bacterium]CAA0117566.1 Uncharacterised protein [BD1-7 clade bacterium]